MTARRRLAEPFILLTLIAVAVLPHWPEPRPHHQVSIQGVHLGDSPDDVAQLLGQPAYSEEFVMCAPGLYCGYQRGPVVHFLSPAGFRFDRAREVEGCSVEVDGRLLGSGATRDQIVIALGEPDARYVSLKPAFVNEFYAEQNLAVRYSNGRLRRVWLDRGLGESLRDGLEPSAFRPLSEWFGIAPVQRSTGV